MSVFTDDVINFTSVLKMAYNFLSGRDYLKKQKFRERKKLISVVLPFSDLSFAAGAVPVFPIRMESFNINQYLLALNSATSILGWGLTTKLLGIIKHFDTLRRYGLLGAYRNMVYDYLSFQPKKLILHHLLD